MFGSETSARIEQLLSNFLLHFAEVNEHVSDPPTSLEESLQHGASLAQAAPFHFALFPEIVRFKTLERSFSSNLGSVFEEAAYLIGVEKFAAAEKQRVVKGRVRATVINQIDQIIRDYETFQNGKRIGAPDTVQEHQLIDRLSGPGGEDYEERVDLYLQGADGVEHYFHMKTIKPNKDQSNKAKRLMLRVHALRYPHPTRVFFGMAYNPYGEAQPYKWSYSKPYFDIANEVLIGGQFWDYIGGEGAFRQLVALSIQSGRDVHDQVKRELGLA